jgi:hypothetical protein
MKQIEDLWVKIIYEVRLGDLEMPQEVFDEINQAIDRGRDIDTMSGMDDDYPNASDWLTENIKENDCMEWKAEIIEIIEKNKI